MANDLDFDSWCAAHGLYLNDDDDGARAARLMALSAWQAAAKAEREACAKICDEARQILESGAALAEADDRPAMLSSAWRISLCAAAIRGR
jgi:hypothetical protein